MKRSWRLAAGLQFQRLWSWQLRQIGLLDSAWVPPQIGGSATLSVTGNRHGPGGDGGTVFQRGSVSQPYRGKSLNLRTGKSTVRSAYSPKWRQLCNAIAAPSTDALKRSSWCRKRVTRSARSAAQRWNRGWKPTMFPHTNLLNVRRQKVGMTSHPIRPRDPNQIGTGGRFQN